MILIMKGRSFLMKKSLIILACVFSAAFLILGVWRFSAVYAYNAAHYPENTTINGVNCSDLTVQEASAKLSKVWNKKTLVLKNGEGETIGRIKNLDLSYDIEDGLTKVMQQSILSPSIKRAIKKGDDLTVPMTAKGTKNFEKQIRRMKFLKRSYTTKTKNAYVDMSNTDFNIVKEVYGDNISYDRFEKKMLDRIAAGNWNVTYKASDYYELPTVLSTSSSLKKKQDYCNKYLTQKIKYNMHVGSGCKVGDFVEVKNSTMGDGAKSSHLTYIGDSDVGKNVNLGCGVVFVNYDGTKKFRSTVKDNAFIGCNSNLISPVTVGEKAYVGAGSTITKDVPDGALYIERAKPKIIEGWVERTGKLDKSK